MISLSAELSCSRRVWRLLIPRRRPLTNREAFQPPATAQTAYLWQFTQGLYAYGASSRAGRVDDAPPVAHEARTRPRRPPTRRKLTRARWRLLMKLLSAELAGSGLHAAAVEPAQAAVDILRGEGARRRRAYRAAPRPRAKGLFQRRLHPGRASRKFLAWKRPIIPIRQPPDRLPRILSETARTVAGAPISSAAVFDSVTGVNLENRPGTRLSEADRAAPAPRRASPTLFSAPAQHQTVPGGAARTNSRTRGAMLANGSATPAAAQGLAAVHLFIDLQCRVHV